MVIDKEGNKWFTTERGVSKWDEKGTAKISVSPDNQDVDSMAGVKIFNVSINTAKPTDMTITDDADWLTVSPTTGKIPQAIKAYFTENTSTSQRIATIMVSGTGATPDTVTVTQSGNPFISVASLSDLNLSIYPNPATDLLKLEHSRPMIEVTVFNMLAQKVGAYELNSVTSFELSLAELKKGMYFIRMRDDSGQFYTRKVIKD